MSDIHTPPLADVRVLAVEQYGAGPWATLQLADLGAEVIKVEDPAQGGDVGRYVPPYQEGTDSQFFEAFNRGKRSVCIDMRKPGGTAAVHDLVRESDALFCNLRGDQPDRLGLTYEALRHVNPRIVCCSLSGFGRTGPRASQGAYDYVLQGLAGWMSLTGEPDGPPAKSGLSLVDFSAGYVAAIAILGGLWRARRDGRGCDCDLSLLEVAVAQLNYIGTWVATNGYRPQRAPWSAHPSIVPFQAFPTSDGWLVVACAKDKFWERLCGALGRDDLRADERFASFAGRLEHRLELVRELASAFRAETTATWVERLEEAGVPAGPVNDVGSALADPQIVARSGVREVEHPRLGRVRHVASPLRLDDGIRDPAPGPGLGHDTDRVLTELCGYDEERLQALRQAQAIA